MKKVVLFTFCSLIIFACTKGKYPTKHSLWYNEQTSIDFDSYGITSVKMIIDGAQVAELETHKYFSNPECGTGNYTYETNMFKREARTHSYEVRTMGDSIIFKGAFQMVQGKCASTELTFVQ